MPQSIRVSKVAMEASAHVTDWMIGRPVILLLCASTVCALEFGQVNYILSHTTISYHNCLGQI